jgi:ADP-ribose pyrophosphatase YjhB (NUDIX family)
MSYVEDIRQYIGHRPLILNGSCVLIFDDHHRLLMQRRHEPQHRWGLLGGLMELGESTADVVVREVKEESSIDLPKDQLQLLGIYSGPNHRAEAPNGDIFYSVITAYVIHDVAATPVISDDESDNFAWFNLTALPTPIVGSHAQIIADYQESHQSK